MASGFCRARLSEGRNPPLARAEPRSKQKIAPNKNKMVQIYNTVKALPRRKPGPTLRALSRRINGSRLSPRKRSGGGFIKSLPLARTGAGRPSGRWPTRMLISKPMSFDPMTDPRPTIEAPDDDPYLWLEEIDGERALAWVDAQNGATLARFGDRRFEADRDTLVAIYDRPDNIPVIARRGAK